MIREYLNNWTSEQQEAFFKVAGTKVFKIVESNLEDRIRANTLTFADLWCAIDDELDMYQYDAGYNDIAPADRLSATTARTATRWRDSFRDLYIRAGRADDSC